jgi:very-short-patch-repair endonuclease
LTVQSLSNHYNAHIVLKAYCRQCNEPIFETRKSFCNSSCAAKYNNLHVDRKHGPSKGFRKGIKRGLRVCPVSWCQICNSLIKHKRIQTCSDTCKRILLSIKSKQNCYKTKYNRGRHKKSYLESSFEEWLVSHNVTNFVMEKKFKRLDKMKTYFVDFYFPELKIAIELDGTQHKSTKKYDQERDQYISEQYHVKIVRISHKDYINKTKMPVIKDLLSI